MGISRISKSAGQTKGLRDGVGRSGVYRFSGAYPEGDAPIRAQMEWGKTNGERQAMKITASLNYRSRVIPCSAG